MLDVPVRLAQHWWLNEVDSPRGRAPVQVLVVLVDLLPGLRRLLEPQARALRVESGLGLRLGPG